MAKISRAPAECAGGLTDAEWKLRVSGERKVGVMVHHLASMYPLEIQLARTLAAWRVVEHPTWEMLHAVNARHAVENDAVTQAAALELLAQQSAAAAAAIRAFGDAELDRAAPVSLHANAPLTCQFMLEAQAVRHSYHHLGRIRRAVQRMRAASGQSDPGWRSRAPIETGSPGISAGDPAMPSHHDAPRPSP